MSATNFKKASVFVKDFKGRFAVVIIRQALLIFVWCIATTIAAQTPIQLQGAIDSAVKNNLKVNNERLRSEYARMLIQSATSIPATNVISELGQINSSYFDTRVGVSQTFNLPAVYARQKQLFTEEWRAALLNVSVKEAEIRKTVYETFYTWLYWKEKEKLLSSIDSIYSYLLQKANLRLQKGESNVLEKTSFENQKTAVELQLVQTWQELGIILQLFQLLLNTNVAYVPEATILKLADAPIVDWAMMEELPALKLTGQQRNIAMANTQVEKSKLLPDFLIGYNNASIKGMGADEKLYAAGYRFHTAQVGLAIPLFNSAQKARIKASRINEQVAVNNYNIEKEEFKNRIARTIIQYQLNRQVMDVYESRYLKNVTTVKETANRQFLQGEINYLDFVVLINQAISIETGYLDAVHNFNQSVIQLNYLNGKN